MCISVIYYLVNAYSSDALCWRCFTFAPPPPTSKSFPCLWSELFASVQCHEVIRFFQQIQTTIGVTTDLWKQKETGSYYATVTALYIDSGSNMHSGLLATRLFVEKHTGANIRTFTMEVLENFGIDVSKCHFTTDSASNNISAFR